MKAKSGEGGRLFGSITSKQIADELNKKEGIKVDRRKMDLPDPIRALGNHNDPNQNPSRCNGNIKSTCN